MSDQDEEPKRRIDWVLLFFGCVCVASLIALGVALNVRNSEHQDRIDTNYVIRHLWNCQEDEVMVPTHFPPHTSADLECVNREEVHK